MNQEPVIKIVVPVKTEYIQGEQPTLTTIDFPRLTATGKISHAKTKVYTQRYRKEWEEMSDFKGWLTSVPYQATRAFCIYCQKNLHAHRLSLLKHMCTLKHQKAASDYKKEQIRKAFERGEIQSLDFIEEDTPDASLFEETNDSMVEDEFMEETAEGEDESMNDEQSQDMEHEKVEIKQEDIRDTLAEAMAHVNEGEEEAEDNNDEAHEGIEGANETTSNVINSDHDTYTQSAPEQNDSTNEDPNENSNKVKRKKVIISNIKSSPKKSKLSPKDAKMISAVTRNNTLSIPNSQKMIVVTSGGKTYALTKGKNPNSPFVLSGSPVIKKVTNMGNKINVVSAIQTKLPKITANVVEVGRGIPCSGLNCTLFKLIDGKWAFVQERETGINGECEDFSPNASIKVTPGRYKIHFDVERYYTTRKIDCYHPFIEIPFDIKNPSGTFHIPLLITPHSFSTFKDTTR